MFPIVPLGSNLNLGLAIVSYSGTLNFGLVGDFNAGHRRSSRSDVRDPCFVVRQTRRPGRLFPVLRASMWLVENQDMALSRTFVR